jgi:uncharacterized protein (TIGR02996 family)
MNPRAAFLKAVVESPDDDALRLVFADWLEEHGEGQRAEFIRLQCAIARMTGTEEQLASMANREKELWQTHGPSWCAELPKWVRYKVSFRRGFPTILSCTPSQWLGARGLLERAPIQALTIQRFDLAKIAALAATAHLAGIRALQVSAYHHLERVRTIKQLSGSACASTLRLLDLYRGGYTHNSTAGDAVARALAASNLSRLECLRLSQSEIGPAGIEALAAAPALSSLRKLDLSDNSLGVEGAQALAASPYLSNLTALHLGDSQIPDRGVAALAQSPHLGRLTHLNVSGRDRQLEAAEAVAASPYLSQLTALSFHFGNIGLAGARALARSPNVAHLTYLDLFQNRIGDAGLQALVESPYLTQLRTLELGANGLTDKGLRALAQAPGLPALERLGLCGTPGVEDAVQALQASPHLPRLRAVTSYPKGIGVRARPGTTRISLRRIAYYPNWIEKATAQEIDEHFKPLHGETLAERL